MKQWLRRIRGAVVIGVVWALAWAPVAVLVGIVIDPDGSMEEMWPAIGAYPGFLGGVLFSVLLAIAARRRRLHELSLPRVAAWGALAGFLVGSIPFVIGEPTGDLPPWMLGVVVVGTITLLSAASAAASLAIARRGETGGGSLAAPEVALVAGGEDGALGPARPPARERPAVPRSGP